MKLAIVSPFPPYRGGISKDSEILYNSLVKTHKVKVFNFTRLYPNFLFPGKSQYIDNYTESDSFNMIRSIDSINPISWHKTSKMILEENYNCVIFRYWHPFIIPSYNYIKNRLKKTNPKIKIFCICDNLFSHERFPFNYSLIKMFFNKIDGFFTMSSKLKTEIQKLDSNYRVKNIFLPIKDNFNPKISKEKAENILGVKNKFVMLFFGLIREYKGLDVLLYALNNLNNKNNLKLLIVGECYEKKEKYLEIIRKLDLSKYIIWIDRYISDKEIHKYFCAADIVTLPYKHVTQSGIIPIAYNYNKLVVVSNLPGLNDYVVEGKTGYFIKPSNVQSLTTVLDDVILNHNFKKSEDYIRKYKTKYTLDKLVEEIISFIDYE